MSEPVRMEPGIYFGLPEADYFGAFALSASGIKNLRISTLDFWARSSLNPDKEDEETEARFIGKAYHKRIIEGRQAFYAIYAPALDPKDHPNAIRTVDDLLKALAELGIKAGSKAKKADLIAMLAEADGGAVIWDRVVESHAEKHHGRTMIDAALLRKIEISAAMIEAHPVLKKAFSGGMPEVSVFYTHEETGVPMKARLDYLKPKAIVDLKTAANEMGSPIDKACARAVASGKLHVQAALYLEAANEARRQISAGNVFGDVEQSFLDALIDADARTFMWVFQMKGVAPVARGYVIPPGITLDMAKVEIDQARDTFKRCWETFGSDPWVDQADIHTFDSTEFPVWISD